MVELASYMYFRDTPLMDRPTSRSQIRGLRNPTPPAQVSGDLVEFRNARRIALNRAPSPRTRLDGGAANRRFFRNQWGDFTRTAKGSRGVDPHPPFLPSKCRFRRISADLAECTWVAPPRRGTGRSAFPRTARIFQESGKIFLHDRPQIHGLRNSTIPAQLRGVSLNFGRSGGTRVPPPTPPE